METVVCQIWLEMSSGLAVEILLNKVKNVVEGAR